MSLGVKIIAIRDTPEMGYDVPTCATRPFQNDASVFDRYRAIVLNDNRFDVNKLIFPSDVRLVDMSDAFCDEDKCFAVMNGILVYRDGHHISATYSRELADVLASKIGDIFR